jgi:hypothetical protein
LYADKKELEEAEMYICRNQNVPGSSSHLHCSLSNLHCSTCFGVTVQIQKQFISLAKSSTEGLGKLNEYIAVLNKKKCNQFPY